MKLIVAGSRDFTNGELIYHILDLWKPKITEIVSGKAKGVDNFGETWALKNQIPIKEFPADWKRKGKSAGPIRNGKMAEYADVLFAFHEPTSRSGGKGTLNMINWMKESGKAYIIWENSHNIPLEQILTSGHTFGIHPEETKVEKKPNPFKVIESDTIAVDKSIFDPIKHLLG